MATERLVADDLVGADEWTGNTFPLLFPEPEMQQSSA